MCPTIIIARQIAARRVKAQLAAQGIKLHQVKARDITRWAEASITAELLAEADAKIEASPELRKIAERQQRPRAKAKATRVPGRDAMPASSATPARPAKPWSTNRLRQRQLLKQAILRAVQQTAQQRRAKRPMRSSRAQFELWPTGIDRYPYRTNQ